MPTDDTSIHNHMGFISCHIMPHHATSSAIPLGANMLTQHMHTDFMDKGNFTKPGMHWPLAGMQLI